MTVGREDFCFNLSSTIGRRHGTQKYFEEKIEASPD
jgi:hypothetical protein